MVIDTTISQKGDNRKANLTANNHKKWCNGNHYSISILRYKLNLKYFIVTEMYLKRYNKRYTWIMGI